MYIFDEQSVLTRGQTHDKLKNKLAEKKASMKVDYIQEILKIN